MSVATVASSHPLSVGLVPAGASTGSYKIETNDRTYHFGFNGWGQFWSGGLPFPARRERGELGLSLFIVIMRVILFGYIGYLMWEWGTGR